jgi:hypothetical protein
MTLPQASRSVLPPRDAEVEPVVSFARAEKSSATRRAMQVRVPEGHSLPCRSSLKQWQYAWPLKLTVALGRLQLPGEPPAQIVVR